jgi:uncharacterized protein YbbC (DUF1343 family)
MRTALSLLLILHGLSSAGFAGDNRIVTGADRMDDYLPLLSGKKIALVVNQTSCVGHTHLVDTLYSRGVQLSGLMKVFVPEHGLRGNFDAGQEVESGRDPQTGIPVVSLYGKHKKPLPEDLEGIDLVLFDIQDVGVRFYTYISTLHYVMESCAENGVPLVVLDRPNPNGGYVDGPVLEAGFASFVGMHPIPVVYGLTIGELAQMINGEGWLAGGVRCDLTVIPCAHYDHGRPYPLPVSPSPNLTSDHAVMLYPSTCFFEGTVISEGRGTGMPFEVYGHPDMEGRFTFTPQSIPGVSANPKYRDRVCHGEDLRDYIPQEGWKGLHLEFLLEAYHRYPRKEEFFTPYFESLAGTADLRRQIEAGWDQSRIRASWKKRLNTYLEIREKYLIYE